MSNEIHQDLMKKVLENISDKPLVLKGGTALMFCYGLDRFSEDLDFDVSSNFKGKGTIKLENSLKTISDTKSMKITSVSIKKNTDTVSRYMITYEALERKDLKLKIEISYRNPIDEKDIVTKNGIKYAAIEKITDFKIGSVLDLNNESRTKSRDLYDTAFIAENHPSAITNEQLIELNKLDLSTIENRYKEAFEADYLLTNVRADEVTLKLGIAVEKELISRTKKEIMAEVIKVMPLNEQEQHDLENTIDQQLAIAARGDKVVNIKTAKENIRAGISTVRKELEHAGQQEQKKADRAQQQQTNNKKSEQER